MKGETAISDSIRLMAKVGKCWSPSFSPDASEIAFVSDLTGRPQVWKMPAIGGFPEAVTAFADQVTRVIWSPSGDWLAVESAPGGGMNTQIDILRPDGSERARVTAGDTTNNWLSAWTKDGRCILYSSNVKQDDSMDCFRVCVETGIVEELAANGGTGIVEDILSDGGRMLIKRVAYRGDNNIILVDSSTSQETLLTRHVPPASFDNARFAVDGAKVYLISNRDRDMSCLCCFALDGDGDWTVLAARDDAELVEFSIGDSDKIAALAWNIAGRNELELFCLRNNESLGHVELPGEIVDSLSFSADGSQLVMRISGSRLPQDIWRLNMGNRELLQLTRSPHIGVKLEELASARLLRYSAHDGLALSGWLFTPADSDAPFPTVVSFHGGPEGQEQPIFRYDYQALLSHGIAVFAPNVRGSSGFGKRFVNLDNGALRFDAIQDIASTVNYLTENGTARSGRIGIMGGSYGGYMTMAGLAEFPEVFAAGVNLYGVVNFKTFFEQTEPWMASISKIEYGDPETEGELLDTLSPIHKLDRVKAPTLVLHGANDTNVPVYEAEQVVKKLRERQIPVEYILFPDEGHGFHNEDNRIAAATAIVNWFRQYLLR